MNEPLPFDPLQVLDRLPVGLFSTDAEGRINWVNRTLGDQLGVAAEALIGLERSALPAKKTLSLSKSIEWLHVAAPGGASERRLECITQKLSDAEESGGEIACVIDVSRYEGAKRPRHLYPELKDPSKLDAQTGLLNKSTMHQELIAQVSRSRRYQNPLTAMLIRVADHTDAGEAVAAIQKQRLSKAIAKLLKDKLRWVDIVGCWDKDEFMLVLPETAIEPATRLARKIDNCFAKLLKEEERTASSDVSVAIGLAEWMRGDDANALLARIRQDLEQQVGRGAERRARG